MISLTHKHFTAIYALLAQAYALRPTRWADSRTGRVCDLGPVAIELEDDGNRLALVSGRELNPFFAFAEAAWILAGRNDTTGLQPFVQRITEYSDDGVTFNGAYGHRLRHHFGYDQIERAVQLLASDSSSRRIVLSLWSPDDLGSTSKDIPCNVVCAVKVDGGRVMLTVFNRSNDYIRGFAYDVFAFSGLQAHLAARLRLEVGRYVHITDSLHVYERDHDTVCEIGRQNDATLLADALNSIPRVAGHYPFHGITVPEGYESGTSPLASLEASFVAWKSGRYQDALEFLDDSEVGIAAVLYLARRRGFEHCTLPRWFLARAAQGPWRI